MHQEEARIVMEKRSRRGALLARPVLTNAGKVVENAINEISIHYPVIEIDKYVVMPNHLHMILLINNDGRANSAPLLRVTAYCKISL